MDRHDMIRIHFHTSNVRTLGPGNRYVLWTQGCLKHCAGCISPEARDMEGGMLVSVDSLTEKILAVSEIEGLTISGGEPFLQPQALCTLIDKLRISRDLGVIVYTGYTIEEIRESDNHEALGLLDRIDLLIDGPYIEAQNDDCMLRGSSNQRAISLTDRYVEYLSDYGKTGRRPIEYRATEKGFFVIGIPDKLRADLLGITSKDGNKT